MTEREAKLLDLLSELYQVLGALDAPEHVLDRVLSASEGKPFSNEPSLLPFWVKDVIHGGKS